MPKKTQYETYHLHAKKDLKRKQAEERQAEYDKLTVAEKFARLIEGGSTKQRAKLAKKAVKTASIVAPAVVVPTVAPKTKKGKNPKA